MKIFITHSNSFDFINDLYEPLKKSNLHEDHEIYLPHENGKDQNTRDIVKNYDVLVAEVSYPSTGSGIEIGWADIFQKPVICIYREGSKISSSLRKITKIFISYKDTDELVKKLGSELRNM
jgi:hypothetical protein